MASHSTPKVVTQASKKTIYQSITGLVAITLIGLLVNGSLRVDFVLLGSNVGETSVIETLQLIMLAITSFSFIQLSRHVPSVRHAAILIAGFFATLIIREMDYWFDKIHHGFWVYPALIIAAIACMKAAKGGKNTINEIASILNAPHMILLNASVMLLLVFSRLYGMGHFWEGVMGEQYVHAVKTISEEGIELLCYCLIAYSAWRVKSTLCIKPA